MPSERFEKIRKAALSPRSTERLWDEFVQHGKEKGHWREDPVEIKNGERKLEMLNTWLHDRNLPPDEVLRKMMAEGKDPVAELLGKMPRKLVHIYWLTGQGDCVVKSAVFVQLARKMGFEAKYHTALNIDLDLSHPALSDEEKKNLRSLPEDHAYASVRVGGNWVQYDPAIGIIGAKHRGTENNDDQFVSQMFSNHAIYLQESGKAKSSMKALGLALEIDPKNPQAHALKGIYTWYSTRDASAAMSHLDKALEIDPRQIKALRFKAVVLGSESRPEEAMKALDRALEIAPNDVRCLEQKMRFLRALGKRQEAQQLQSKLAALKE
jgi:tetratricopeptide (TPR) repeat protein